MSDPTSGWARYASPAVLFGITLTGVAAVFNYKFGSSLGGSDQLRCYGMGAVAVAALGLKDYFTGRAFVSFKERRWSVFALCLVAVTLGASVSFLAAFGSASTGQAEKANPLQARIDSYQAAKASEKSDLEQLAALGTFRKVTKADIDGALAGIDKTVARRTSGCTNLAPEGSGPKAQSWNREACQPVTELLGDYDKGQQAAPLYADLKAARAVIAKGAPESADALNDNLSDMWKKITGQGNVKTSSVVALAITLIVEIGGPISWAVHQLDAMGRRVPLPGVPVPQQAPAEVPSSTPPSPRKRRKFQPRSDRQKQANAIAEELRNSGKVVSFSAVRSEYHKRFGTPLPKVTAHRAVG